MAKKTKVKEVKKNKMAAMPLVEGSRVALTWDLERKGRIKRLGPQQSEVKLDDGKDRCFINTELVRIKE